MNRRTFITAGLIAAPVAASANGLLSNVWTAITGHASDAKSRLTAKDNYIAGKTTHTGKFNEEARGQDIAHWAKGTISIVETEDGNKYIQFGNDFNSGPLPDGYVYFSATNDIQDEDDFFNSVQHEVGPLTQGTGAHYYQVPAGLKINSVTVWCKAFSQYIGSADVKVI